MSKFITLTGPGLNLAVNVDRIIFVASDANGMAVVTVDTPSNGSQTTLLYTNIPVNILMNQLYN